MSKFNMPYFSLVVATTDELASDLLLSILSPLITVSFLLIDDPLWVDWRTVSFYFFTTILMRADLGDEWWSPTRDFATTTSSWSRSAILDVMTDWIRTQSWFEPEALEWWSLPRIGKACMYRPALVRMYRRCDVYRGVSTGRAVLMCHVSKIPKQQYR